MNRCRAALVLLFAAVAVPLSARVISYAPYTNRIATPAFQERTTRHFVLIETPQIAWGMNVPNEVVLYDSTGAEEPRVILPKDRRVYDQAALYQKPNGRPIILTISRDVVSANWWLMPPIISISEDGTNWRDLTGIGAFGLALVVDTDTGGPYTHGLSTPILPGNDTWPFVVSLPQNGVWAIGSNGTSKALVKFQGSRVVGSDAARERFLVHAYNAIYMVDLATTSSSRVADVDPAGAYSGWITSSGQIYVQMLRAEGRFLYMAKADDSLEFIAGPYNTPSPRIGSPQQTGTTMRFFAVPTHDYEGAWIIQRQTGFPTKLSKHTVADGLDEMWSDISGPQVEALIAGPSGNSLLVQVHRERDGVELNRPFIDPALAIWRTGEREPRGYDELYLNENWNKGFVHVDVEEIASGKPFVFHSGFEPQDNPVSRVSPPIAGGGDVIQEWGVVRGSLKQRLVIPGAARLRGMYNSFWLTDLNVSNPLEVAQKVEVQFVPLGTTQTLSKTITLEPLEIRAIHDALGTLFGVEDGGGTLHFLPEVGINATARTYSRKPDGGTFGFGMQAIDYFNAAGPRFPLSFSGAFPGDHFRTNLLLTDTSGRGTRAKVQASGLLGNVGSNNLELETPAGTTVQLAGVGPAAGFLQSSGGGLRIEPTRGTAIATVVAIDNRTNDPTYFPPDLPASVTRAIPVIGHVDGANGSKFRSDVYLYNPESFARTVMLVAKMWDSNTTKTVQFTLLPNENRVIPDVLKTLFGMEGLARLTYSTIDWSPGDGVRLTSRTYNVDPTGATYGCLVPPLNSFQIAGEGDSLEILGISGGDGFRTNIGLVDLSDATQNSPEVRVTVLDERHRVRDTFTVYVPGRGGMQINDIFAARGFNPPPAAMVILEIVTGQQIGAYATLTDNVTNDSTYLAAHLGARP